MSFYFFIKISLHKIPMNQVCSQLVQAKRPGLNLVKLLGAFLGTLLNQVNGAKRINKRQKNS
jgi:hypothetical protein